MLIAPYTGYFDIVLSVDAKLVAVDTDIAEVAEMHLMALENRIMRMRAVHAANLPAGKPASLKPGGFHVMLFDLRQRLHAGERIPIQLLVEDVNERRTKLTIEVDVRNLDGSKVLDHRDRLQLCRSRHIGSLLVKHYATWSVSGRAISLLTEFRRIESILRRPNHATAGQHVVALPLRSYW